MSAPVSVAFDERQTRAAFTLYHPKGNIVTAEMIAALTQAIDGVVDNPHLKLMVGSGYYDLVTPLGLAEYTVDHAGIPLPATRFAYYESGHMPYLGAASRAQLAADLRHFVTE